MRLNRTTIDKNEIGLVSADDHDIGAPLTDFSMKISYCVVGDMDFATRVAAYSLGYVIQNNRMAGTRAQYPDQLPCSK